MWRFSSISDDDDEGSQCARKALECPICCESFNVVENVPFVLWCGHSLCKNCIMSLQWAVVKFPSLPVQLPLFISCPWCYMLSFRLVYKGQLKFPRKNFFLLWVVESMNGSRERSYPSMQSDGHPHHRVVRYFHRDHSGVMNEYTNPERIQSSLRKSLVLFVHLTAKFPLVLIFFLIVLCIVPASVVVLALYVLVTVLFALPSLLILYVAYPSLDWLVREIMN